MANFSVNYWDCTLKSGDKELIYILYLTSSSKMNRFLPKILMLDLLIQKLPNNQVHFHQVKLLHHRHLECEHNLIIMMNFDSFTVVMVIFFFFLNSILWLAWQQFRDHFLSTSNKKATNILNQSKHFS